MPPKNDDRSISGPDCNTLTFLLELVDSVWPARYARLHLARYEQDDTEYFRAALLRTDNDARTGLGFILAPRVGRTRAEALFGLLEAVEEIAEEMIRNVERFEEDEEDEVVLETVEVEEEIRPKETRARRAKKDDKRSVSQQDTGGEDELVEETEVVQPRRGLRPRNATGAKTNDDAGESNGSGSEVVGRCSRSGTAKQANAAAGKEAAKKEKPKNGGKKKKGKR